MQSLHKKIKDASFINLKILKLYKYFNYSDIYKKIAFKYKSIILYIKARSDQVIEAELKVSRHTSHPMKENAPRYDLTVTHRYAHGVCMRMRGKAAPVQAAPMESTKREEEPLRFHTTWLLGRGEAREERPSRARDKEVGSRARESVNCGALKRLGQSRR